MVVERRVIIQTVCTPKQQYVHARSGLQWPPGTYAWGGCVCLSAVATSGSRLFCNALHVHALMSVEVAMGAAVLLRNAQAHKRKHNITRNAFEPRFRITTHSRQALIHSPTHSLTPARTHSRTHSLTDGCFHSHLGSVGSAVARAAIERDLSC